MSSALVKQMADRETKQLQAYSKVYRHYILAHDIENALFFLEEITGTLYFPLIITDEHDEPVQDYLSHTLNIEELKKISSIEYQREFLIEQIKVMKEFEPIIVSDEEENVIAKFYYSHSTLADMLRYFPVLAMTIAVLVVVMGYFIFNAKRNSEQSRV
jgi:hypothetical protein